MVYLPCQPEEAFGRKMFLRLEFVPDEILQGFAFEWRLKLSVSDFLSCRTPVNPAPICHA